MKKILLLALVLVFIFGCNQNEIPMQEDMIEEQDSMMEQKILVTEEEEDNIMDDKEDMVEDDDTMVASYTDVSPTEAKNLIDTKPDLIVIDVSPAYDKGHLPGAVNYYVGDGSLDEAIPSLDPEDEYLVYCHVDSAAIAGAQKLIDAGFKTVYRLEGNYAAWVDAGYPIEM